MTPIEFAPPTPDEKRTAYELMLKFQLPWLTGKQTGGLVRA
jgi:hypothetical protein